MRHGNAGKRSSRAKPEPLRERVLSLVRSEYGGGQRDGLGPPLAAEHLQSDHGLVVGVSTLRARVSTPLLLPASEWLIFIRRKKWLIFICLRQPLVLVCDRYAAYGKLARECAGQFVLAICWVHARRDFVTLGRRWPEQQAWVEQILERIARLYQLNAQRLPLWQARYEDCLAGQSAPFQAAQQALSAACAELFEHAAQELAALQAAAESAAPGASPDPRLAPLQSLLRYRRGLSVFLSKPFVPLDNNPVERIFRRLVVGRKLSYGSHSEEGAVLQGRLLSVLTTLALAGIDLRRWLAAFLGECARIGRTAVVRQPQAWLPWGLPAPRRQALLAAGRAASPGPDP